MQTKDFHFDLPEELIAQQPSPQRGGDRLLLLNRATGRYDDRLFSDLAGLIEPGTLMVFNDSKVRRARIYATVEQSGNQAEFLLIAIARVPGAEPGSVWKVMAKNAKRQKPGRAYAFPDGTKAEIIRDPDGALEGTEFRLLKFERPIDDAWLEKNGHLPLPPYIRREDELADSDRYQTVYARKVGSVAAPTAGLHFTEETLAALDARGIERTTVTLHVGLGTFLPVRAERVEDHVMHEESYSVSEETSEKVSRAKREGRPVLAVGTTSIRTLESAWDEARGRLRVGIDSTRIFIYPGYRFKVVDQVFTNFHTPESTLLMLVSAFAGKENILAAYGHAVAERYRFFSYGDSMLIR
ncbi:MAG TPA: tRNA preQ1(34) S-adenosylmethionine ribosyltransferase-isomerase QueA [Treponemataceae bacterium]|nr:tRNA preQ1(34) S-adenosylmethionine ribosyltransferase-isomerase QueA [Treponemataceae bacterium]